MKEETDKPLSERLREFLEFDEGKEQWRSVVGYVGYYEVSNYGRVRSLRFKNNTTNKIREKPYIMKGNIDRKGYHKVMIGRKNKSVHTLVLESFVALRPSANHECNHINAIRHDNRPENLEWVTHKENCRHTSKLGNNKHQDDRKPRKFTPEQVKIIREIRALGIGPDKLAALTGTSPGYIYAIVTGKNWNRIPIVKLEQALEGT